MTFSFASRLARSSFVLLCLLGCGLARGQLSLDREPPGPSSRKTGLVITEIMYHPRPVPGLTNRLQFIEIFNSKPWDEAIGGFSLDGTIRYTFASNTVLAAGAYLVVARDPGFLQTNYSITNVVGPWVGSATNGLSIDRGTVLLRNRQGAVLLTVNYSDAPPWPVAADGSGHSIVLARPSYGEDDARAWAESDVIGGSPGLADPVPVEPLASVVINEWMAHTHLPLRDSIELYNHANVAVDLSGAYLSDTPDTNRYRIPNGTIIGPGGFRAFDDSILNFSLFAEGETIFLVNSNQTRVIDAIDFKGMSNSVSAGRYPDGGPLQYALASRTFGGPNSKPKRWAVVINEIMYNPISGDADDEYVEIYNRTASSFNLSGWAFTNGINYTFPNGAMIPAGAYWVVARNPTNLFSIYSNLNSGNTFGPYTGTLANGGERLTLSAADYDTVVISNMMVNLKLNVIASEVVYGDGGRWGNWSDGAGASLELIDPEADTKLPSNWADSDDTGESQWTAIESTVALGETLGVPANDSLMIILQGIGECLVDEVEVRVNGGPNLVANGGFEAGLNGWSLQGSHDFSTIEGTGFAGSASLHVRAGSRGENQSNRILSAPFASTIPADAPVSIRAKVKWLRGHPEILLRLHGGGAEAYGMMALPKKLGTPGTVNSRRVPNAGPAIYDVKHAPLLPAPGEPVVVSARAVDPQGVGTIRLRYRIDPEPTYTDIAMLDDGTGGDEIANDGIYSATIPGQADGTVVPFYLEARDTTSGTNTFPQDVFPPPGLTRCWPNDAVARECVLRWGEVQMPGDLATYHLWLSAVNSNRWHTRDPMNNTAVDGTFVYNNSRVVYNALPLYSGSPWHRTNSTTGPAGLNRVDYEMNFPGDDPLLGTTDFVLNNPGNADVLTISDLSAVAEQTVYRVMEGMGLIQNHRRYVHFFVNGSQRSTTTQRPGNFIFEDSQQPSGDMIDQWFPNDAGGQLFKVEDWFEFRDNGFDIEANNDADLIRRTILRNGQPALVPAPYRFMFRKRSIGVGNSANDYSQIFALVDAVSPADNPTNAVIDPVAFGAVADWEQWMRVFAVQRAVGNWDSYGWARGKNDYWYKPAAGLFQHMTWDIDYSMGLGRPWNEPLFDSNEPRVTAMFNTPEIVRAYWRGFTDLVNGPFNNETLDPFIDARISGLTANNVNIDPDAVTGIKTYIAERRGFLLSQLATVAAVFAVDGPLAYSTTNNLIMITGSAPVEVKTITLNGAAYPLTWTSVTNFMVRVVAQSGFNTYTFQGFDRFGTPIASATQVLTVEYDGPVAEPVGSLIISEIMFAPEATGGQFIEIMNRSEFNFDLAGWRLEGVNLTFPPAAIVTNGQILVLAQNRAAFRAAYGDVPVFAVFGGSLSAQGQAIALVRPGLPLPETVDGVRFEAEAPWPAATNGVSLQLIDAAQDNGRFGNWALDTLTRATPGATNSVAGTLAPNDPLWLNEVHIESMNGALDNMGEPEPWLELHNSGFTELSLDGYYLATSYTSNLTEWPFPPGLTLAPGGYLLLWADGQPEQTDGTNLHTSFRFDYKGKVALVRISEGQPQIMDYLTWRLPYVNVSYGSYPEGQAVFRNILQDPTPQAPNTRRPLAVMINEWMAGNGLGIRDPADNARDDWFELYSAETFTVDLSGFYLTDDLANPTKYRIPANGQYRIAPGGYLLVWADNQTNQNSPARADLHANFKLASSAGEIGLYAPDGVTTIDTITYGLQFGDISEGRYTDGASPRFLMTNSTPRARNSTTIYNARPVFLTLPNRFVSPGTTNTYSITAYDPDSPPQFLAYSIVSAPAISQTGGSLYRWRVPADQPLGDYLITLRVTDNGSPPRSDVDSFTITVRAPGSGTGTGTNTNTLPPVVIRSISGPNGEITFTTDTLPGHAYRVLYTDDLNSALWAQLYRDFVAADPTASITDTTSRPYRFYRMVRLD
jgi:hypothetical protein